MKVTFRTPQSSYYNQPCPLSKNASSWRGGAAAGWGRNCRCEKRDAVDQHRIMAQYYFVLGDADCTFMYNYMRWALYAMPSTLSHQGTASASRPCFLVMHQALATACLSPHGFMASPYRPRPLCSTLEYVITASNASRKRAGSARICAGVRVRG